MKYIISFLICLFSFTFSFSQVLSEKNKIPTDCKYVNPHVVYDGINWFICVGIEFE